VDYTGTHTAHLQSSNSIPVRGNKVSLLDNIQTGSRTHQRLPQGISPEAKRPGREGHLHQVAKLRICGCSPITLARFPMFTSVPQSVCRNSYLKLGHVSFLLCPFLFIIRYYQILVIIRYIVGLTASVVKNQK
jgi:hypothetical protein